MLGLPEFCWNGAQASATLSGMKHISKLLLALCAMWAPLLAQQNPTAPTLHEAFVLEEKGQYNNAINIVNFVINSGELNGVQLGRAYVMLGMAYHQMAKFGAAQSALESALRILEREPEYRTDYAVALSEYASLSGDTGKMDAAMDLWRKAAHLRESTGDHAASMRTLLNLASVALAQKSVSQARKFIKQASHEMKSAQDLTDDDRMLFSETQGWLEFGEGHASAAVGDFQRALDMCVRTRGEQYWLTGWEHLMRGKAYARSGDLKSASADMQEGLAILERTLGRASLKYFAGEIAYSQVLDQAGLHAEAARLRAAAQRDGKDFDGRACTECTIDRVAFR
jgi:tetratricopeptide (TPR) repeat protein